MTMETAELTKAEEEKLAFIRQKRVQLNADIEALKAELRDITTQIEHIDVQGETEDPLVKKKNNGKKKFNLDPKKGMEFLFENELLQRTPEEVAKFFHNEENLNKKAVGDYMGEVSKEFNLKVLEEFTNMYDFTNTEFMPAFRHYLTGFHLPGESQKIEKVVTVFSDHYFKQNPDKFKSAHEVFVLSYAVILLNTTLYNASVKSENGLGNERVFVDTMLNYDESTDFQEDIIRRVYNDISKEPLKALLNAADNEIPAYVNPLKEGYLYKLGGRVKSWKQRWFILNEQCLFYFVSPDRHQAKGIIPLERICIRKVQDKTKENCFELYSSDNQTIKACKTDKEGVVVAGKHNVYRMSARTAQEKDEWFKAIQDSIDRTEPKHSSDYSSARSIK